jgi:hypothetical protein
VEAADSISLVPQANKNERAYTTNANIYDERIAKMVYARMMDAPITVTQRELLSLAPELRNQVSEATARRRLARVNAQAEIEFKAGPPTERTLVSHMPASFLAAMRVPPANATIIADPYEAFLKNHATGAQLTEDTIEVAAKSNSLRAMLEVSLTT